MKTIYSVEHPVLAVKQRCLYRKHFYWCLRGGFQGMKGVFWDRDQVSFFYGEHFLPKGHFSGAVQDINMFCMCYMLMFLHLFFHEDYKTAHQGIGIYGYKVDVFVRSRWSDRIQAL